MLATDAEGAEVGAASAKRARHGSETEVRLPPAYAHPVAHPAPAPSRTNMCCRAYHYAFAFAAVAAVAALAAVALAADAPPRAPYPAPVPPVPMSPLPLPLPPAMTPPPPQPKKPTMPSARRRRCCRSCRGAQLDADAATPMPGSGGSIVCRAGAGGGSLCAPAPRTSSCCAWCTVGGGNHAILNKSTRGRRGTVGPPVRWFVILIIRHKVQLCVETKLPAIYSF